MRIGKDFQAEIPGQTQTGKHQKCDLNDIIFTIFASIQQHSVTIFSNDIISCQVRSPRRALGLCWCGHLMESCTQKIVSFVM